MVQFKKGLGWLLMAGALWIPATVQAQIEPNLSTYTGKNANGYLAPLNEAFAATMQSGMFRSAAIPKNGFSIQLGVVSSFVKFEDGDKTFTAQTEEGFFPPSDVEAPTVIGSTQSVVVDGEGGAQAIFPGGLDVESFGVAVPQISIGSFAGTQLLGRFIAVKLGDADIGDLKLFGVGLRHSLSQYFPEPPIDVAVSGMYQKFEVGSKLVDANALSFGAQASKRFGVAEPYVGLSYDTFKTTIEYEDNQDPPVTQKIDLDEVNEVHVTAGLDLHLSVVHLFGEISSASRTIFAAGLSVGN
jgi:hypothetical protein